MRVTFTSARYGTGKCPRCNVNVFKGMAVCYIGRRLFCRPCGTAASRQLRADETAREEAVKDATAHAKRTKPRE